MERDFSAENQTKKENKIMKKKTVMRLLAVVLAVSLAATSGVPGTALTGVETVYAAGTQLTTSGDGVVTATDTSITINTGAKADNVYNISKTSGLSKLEDFTTAWVTPEYVSGADSTPVYKVTFTGLESGTTYYIYSSEATKTGGATTGDVVAASAAVATLKPSLTKEMVTIENNGVYTYTGSAIKPKVTIDGVAYDDTANSVFTVAYVNNQDATTSVNKTQITITPAAGSKYESTKPLTLDFTINPASITTATFATTQSSTYSVAYDGNPQTTTFSVFGSASTTALTVDTHYTVAYKNNTNVGTATATITGIGNYTGTKELTFTITKAAFSTGSFPTVTAQGSKGDKTTDTADTLVIETTSDPDPALYTVEYALSTSTDPSTFTNWQTSKKFTGLTADTTYYVGMRVLESANTAASAVKVETTNKYTTKKPDLSTATVTLVSENDTTFTGATYTGNKIVPARIDVKIGETLLTSTDYDVEYYYGDTKVTNPTDAGTVTVVIKGKNNYSGTNKTASYTIAKKNVTVTVEKNNATKSNSSLTKVYDGTTNITGVYGTFKSPYTYATGNSDISYFTFSGTLASKDKADAVKVTAIDASSAKAYTSENAELKHDSVNVAQNYNITIDLASDVTAEITAASTLTIGSDNTDDLDIQSYSSDVEIAYGQTIDLKMTNPLGLDLEYTFEKPEIAKQYLTLKDGKLTSIKYPGDSFDIVLYVSYPASAASEKTNYDGTALSNEKVTLTIKSSKASLAVTLNGANVQGAAGSQTLTAALTDGEAKIKAAMGVTARYVTNGKTDGAVGAEYAYVPYSKLKFEYAKGASAASGFSTTFPTEEGKYTVKISNTDSNIDLASAVTLTLTLDNSAKPIDDSILDGTGDKAQIVSEDGTDMLYKADGTLASNELVDVDGDTYYANKDGEVVKDDKVTVGGKDYVLDKDGKVVKGQVTTTPSGNKVYVDKTGAIVKNKVVTYKGKKYYATRTGRIAINTFVTTKLGNKVYATKDGSLKVNVVFTVGKYKYYAGSNAAIATSGLTKTKSGNTVFATASGKLKVSTTFKYKGVKYKANAKGVVKKVK
jgi:hypothetical protein